MKSLKNRKIYASLCALLALALLLCACAGKDMSAPDGVSSSLPEGDSGADADAPSAPRTLTEEEMAELWGKLEGCTCLLKNPQEQQDSSTLSKMIYSFAYSSDGRYEFKMGLPESEWDSLYVDTVTEQNGVYTFQASERWGMFFRNEYEAGTGETVSFSIGEDDVLTLSISVPSRYGQWKTFSTEEGDSYGGRHWRLATPEEEQQARDNGADEAFDLDNKDCIEIGYTYGPVPYLLDSVALPEGAHWLSADEASAFWDAIAGQWIPADESMWDGTGGSRDCPLYEISHDGNSYGTIENGSAFGSEIMRWSFRAVAKWEEGYVLEAMSENSGYMVFTDCYPGAGTQFFLKIVGDELRLSWSQPTRVWWREKPAPDPPAYNFARMPTEEELDKLAHAEDDATSIWLSDNSAIVGEYHTEPILLRRTTGEELESIGNWYVNALG